MERPLPRPASLVFGRDAEFDTVRTLVEGGARVVVVHGARGMGTSRLALRVGHALEEAGDEVLLVPLESVRSEQELRNRLGQTLAVAPEVADATGDAWPIPDALLARGRCVLLLDDAGSLEPAAMTLLDDLVNRAPELVLLAASARRLEIAGARHVTLAPLEAGDGYGPAVALLADRAGLGEVHRLSATTRAALVQIADELSGLPLALEIAAPRLRLVSPEELTRLIRDHQGLLARRGAAAQPSGLERALDWSLDMLTPPELMAAAALAHFRGPFDLQDAAALLAAPLSDVLDLLARFESLGLLLVARGEAGARFALLRPMAAHVRRRMRSEMNAVGRAYEERLLVLADAIRRGVSSSPVTESERLRDLRCALDRVGAERPGSAEAVRLALALATVAGTSGPLREGVERLQRASMAVRRDALDDELLAELYMRQGGLLQRLGDITSARERLHRALDLAVPRGPAAGEAELRLAMIALSEGQLEEARRRFSEAAASRVPPRVESSALFGLASLAPVAQAAELAERGLRAGNRSPTAVGVASAAVNAGYHAIWRGDGASARRHLERGLQQARDAGLGYLVGHAQALLALAADLDGRPDSEANYRRAIETFDRVGAITHAALLRDALGQHLFFHGRLAEARAQIGESLDTLPEGDGRYTSVCWASSAAMAAAAGEREEATQALSSARRRVDGLRSEDAFIYRSTVDLYAAMVDVLLAGTEGGMTRHEARAALATRIAETGDPPADMLFYGDPQLRLLRRWLERWLCEEAPPSEERPLPTLLVKDDFSELVVPGSPPLDLRRRGNVRRVLAALIAHRDRGGLDRQALFAAGWPGENIRPESAAERVYWAIKVLRRAGLRPYLMHTEAGYRLDPALLIDRLE